ncbi:864_t:CDS:10, partial [Entrophospora sp. SA101]
MNNGNSGGTDFVKKLYKMLEDDTYNDIVCWGVDGNSFVVKEIDAFTKTILPRHFKHTNFASFVRQLNKYDFHKVRYSDDSFSPYGEQAWEFHHTKFQCNKKDQLDSIKRKVTTNKRNQNSNNNNMTNIPSQNIQLSEFQSQINNLNKLQYTMNDHLITLSKNYHSVAQDLLNLEKGMIARDQLIQNLAQRLASLDEVQKLINSYTEAIRPSIETSKRAQLLQNMTNNPNNHRSNNSSNIDINKNPNNDLFNNNSVGNNMASSSSSTSSNNSLTKITSSTNRKPNVKMCVMQKSFAPAWSVPPKVLLVDDDAIYQNIGSKLLRVFGCSFDIAVDGLSAVRKMNFAKYDLVLMDIVLPNLDGVEATTQIRRFDMTTPIISMTSNIGADDCFKYLSHGMNDILAKPFTKANLLSMLERHCKHLIVIKTFQNIPRSIVIENNNNCTSSDEDNRIIEEIPDNTNISTGGSS